MSYYDILQIPSNANIIDIKKQFRLLATKYHPDNHNTGDAKLFSQVAQAYECLSNDSKRNDYDRSLQIENDVSIKEEELIKDSLYYRKSFKDFISSQPKDTQTFENAKKQFQEQMNVYSASLMENPKIDINKRMADFEIEREQAELEFSNSVSKISYKADNFNTIFDNKYKKKSNQIIKIEELAPVDLHDMSGNMLSYSAFDDEPNNNDAYLDNYASSIQTTNNIYSNNNMGFETLKISKSDIDSKDMEQLIKEREQLIKEREEEYIFFKNNNKQNIVSKP
jgi:curved DNA-binding protein CbpA